MKLGLIATVTALGLTLTGCGGGGGGSSAAAPVANQTPSTPSPTTVDLQPETPTPTPQPGTQAADLQLTNEFALSSHVEVPVQIDISGLNNDSGYLSICPELTSGASSGEPDYNNCFVRTALPESVYTSSLDLSTAQGVAYSAIWFLDQSEDPLITRHDLSTGGISLTQ